MQTSGAEEFGPDSQRDVSDGADGDSACGTPKPVPSEQSERSDPAAPPCGPGCRERARDTRLHSTWDPGGPRRRPAVPAPAAAWSFLAFSSCLEVLGFILLIKRTSHCLYERCSNSPPPPIGPVTSPGSKGWARWSDCGSPSPAVEPLGVHLGTPCGRVSVCSLHGLVPSAGGVPPGLEACARPSGSQTLAGTGITPRAS